jgi:hypothetical protein
MGTTAFFVAAGLAGTTAFATTQSNDVDHHQGGNNQQYYGSGEVHAMMALAMR